jgi:exopolyphosphatase / guanosine-5'-triphosphate,3'-diphosphate pyrophosphatase
MRVAAIDLGTNTTRLLVADVDGERIAELTRSEEITGLGEGVDARRRLLPLPIARVRNCLSVYRRMLEELGAECVLAVGTSALRDADNGEAFLGEVEWSYGFSTRLLSGEEEASLTFRGAMLGRGDDDGTMVVDVGGGSTELVMRDRATSVDLGSVRLTEQFGEDVDAIAAAVRGSLPALPARDAIGVAGTITSLAALDLRLERYERERVHGHVLTAAAVDEQLQRLASMSLKERRRLGPLDPKRAPVIVAGAVIVREVLRKFELGALEASEHDLLYGVALEATALPEPAEGDAPPSAYTCC